MPLSEASGYGGLEACGSPGEVANEPMRGNHYNTFMTDVGDPAQGWPLDIPTIVDAAAEAAYTDKVDDFNEKYMRTVDKRQQKDRVWTAVVMKADDQLRQRVAWALSQIFVVSDSIKWNEVEVWQTYYDIFVRCAARAREPHYMGLERSRMR